MVENIGHPILTFNDALKRSNDPEVKRFIERLRELLIGSALDDEDECSFDRHGFCQTHYLETNCTVKMIRSMLK